MEFHAATALASNVPTPVSVRLRAVQKQKKPASPSGRGLMCGAKPYTKTR